MPYLLLTLAFSFNAAANILLKVAASRGFSFAAALRGAWTNAEWFAVFAAFLFALNLATYLAALQRLPLSIGYPVMIGMTFVIITSVSFLMGERISLLHTAGLVLIFAGLLVIIRATV